MYPIHEAHLPRGSPPITVTSLVSSSTGARLRSRLPKRHVAVAPILCAAMYKRAAQHRPRPDCRSLRGQRHRGRWQSVDLRHEHLGGRRLLKAPPALYDNRRERLEGGALPNTPPRLCSAILCGSGRINITCRFRSRASFHFQIRWRDLGEGASLLFHLNECDKLVGALQVGRVRGNC